MKTENSTTRVFSDGDENQQSRPLAVTGWPLTQAAAMIAMENGQKVHHRNFFDWEYLQQCTTDKDLIVNEENWAISKREFFETYTNETFKEGWAIFYSETGQVHELKIHPEYIKDVATGFKNFEVRKADRQFAIGDRLLLKEWCPIKERYTGVICLRKVIYILKGGQFGIEDGYVVLGIEACQ